MFRVGPFRPFRAAASDSPPTFSASAKRPEEKFRVESPPISFIMPTSREVPYARSPSDSGCFTTPSVTAFDAVWNGSGRAIATPGPPASSTEIAFTFLLPSTAPSPPRVAARRW
jgi:hypothetical protein